MNYNKQPVVIHSSSSDAKFLDVLRLRDSGTAAYAAIWFLQNLAPPMNSKKAIEGALEVYNYKKGNTATLEADRLALTSLKHTWSLEWTEAKNSFLEQTNNYQMLIEAINNTRTKQSEDFEKAIAEHKEELNNQFVYTKMELNNLIKVYDEHMALQSPVTYWETRRTRSFWVAAGSMALFTLVVVVFLTFFINDLVNEITTTNGSIDWSHLGYVFFVFTMVFWLTRILIRVFLSNLHLGTDASERAVLIKTYLAMSRDEKAISKESKDSMLASVFRPSTNGLIQDDALPHVMYEWLTRVGKK